MSEKTINELRAEARDLMQKAMKLARFIRSMVDEDQEDSFLFQMASECLVHRLIRIDDEYDEDCKLPDLRITIRDIGEDIE